MRWKMKDSAQQRQQFQDPHSIEGYPYTRPRVVPNLVRMETTSHLEHDFHHVFWERRKYRSKIEKQVRNLGAFVVYTPKIWHDELHARVDSPLKPPAWRLQEIHDLAVKQDFVKGEIYGLEWLMDYAYDRQMYPLFDNLITQHYYLTGSHEENYG